MTRGCRHYLLLRIELFLTGVINFLWLWCNYIIMFSWLRFKSWLLFGRWGQRTVLARSWLWKWGGLGQSLLSMNRSGILGWVKERGRNVMQFCYLDNQQYSSKLAWPCNLGSHKGLQLPSSEAIWPQLHYSAWLLLIWPIGNSLETLEARNGLFSSFWGNCLLVDRIILCPSSTSYSLSLLGPI